MKKNETISIENHLNKEGFVVYKVKGKSMEPMLIHNKDIVTIETLNNSLYLENDIILFKENEKLILHRVIKIIDNNQCITLGDNCSREDCIVNSSNVLGKLTQFTHNGVHYYVTDDRYLQYIQRLRDCERIRKKRKLIYDIIVLKLSFLPPSLLTKIKKLLKVVITIKVVF